MLIVPGPAGDDLFREAQREAFHLEVRDSYAVASESEGLRRFLAGEPDTTDYDRRPWAQFMRETTARGVAVRRVRVVSAPHSDYQRWLLSITGSNVAAGEDIRYVPRHLAGDVPPDDWWLFDGELVAYNLVDDDGWPAGMAVTSDPRIAEYCRRVRDRLWSIATPYAEYVGTVPR
ncbi:DUF6879 family protein [Nocardia sp. NPDC004860]|uniref:DUF6879 family protein n=1 Tax=Nocardia sp. NPDC004860 TaxID=3154557 RepID=UPI0033B80F5F